MKTKNQKGFAGIELVLLVVALVATGSAGYFAYQARQDKADYSVNIPHKKAAAKKAEAPAPVLSTLTPYGGSPIQYVLPSGWSKLDDFSIMTNISGIKYKLSFQITDSDWLKGNYGVNASLIKNLKTANGTPLYLIKDDTYGLLSGCALVAGRGCSLQQNGRPMLVMLSTINGPQAPGRVDFNNSSTTDAINGVEAIVTSLRY